MHSSGMPDKFVDGAGLTGQPCKVALPKIESRRGRACRLDTWMPEIEPRHGRACRLDTWMPEIEPRHGRACRLDTGPTVSSDCVAANSQGRFCTSTHIYYHYLIIILYYCITIVL